MTAQRHSPGGFAVLGNVVRRQWWRILAAALALVIGYYALQLAALMVRFGAWPNYAHVYDWPGAVMHILRSTPSLTDALAIISGEWLFELGHMNHDFGPGISEWSLNVQPVQSLVLLLFGILLFTYFAMLGRLRRHDCSLRSGDRTLGAVAGSLVAVTSTSMSWVVCCATPTWVVGLSMLGLGVSASLLIEPFGPWLLAAGFGLLAVQLAFLVRRVAVDTYPATGQGEML